MGGQAGGMTNEQRRFPEVCKKSLQAMAGDMQGAITERFFDRYRLVELKGFTPRELEAAGRLNNPLLYSAATGRYQEITWDEALARVATALRRIRPEQAFFYFSGRSSNEAAFLLQLFARVYGTNHVNNCSYYCHQASGVGLGTSVGTGTATLSVDDLDQSDLFFLIGGNPASNHPRLMTHLMHLRRRGGQVVVVNPLREQGLVRFRIPSDPRSLVLGTKIASPYIQVRIGGDIAFLMGVAKGLLELESLGSGPIDRAFIAQATAGFAAVESLLAATSFADLETCSGVSTVQMREVAALYAKSQCAVFGWTMGITHHVHGVENVHWIVNLALMRGMVGRPGAGLLPIRGHSNVQGIGSMGVTPALKEALLERLTALGVVLPRHEGLDTMGCMDAAHQGRLKFGLALGGNLFGSNPDADYAAAAFANLDLMIYLSTSLNTGHAHGLGRETLILPVLARDEEPFATTQESMFNFVRLSDGGPRRHGGPQSEISVIASLAERVLGPASGPIDWRELAHPDAIRRLVARVVPGYEPVADIAATKQEFVVGGRLLSQAAFPTATGRAQFHAHAAPRPKDLGANEFVLMTIRSEGQFNTVVYEDQDLYRGQERRDVILMAAADMQRLGLRRDQLVTVRNQTGSMSRLLVRPFAITPGDVAMYYPEANVLVPRDLDPASKTPAFKAVRVAVEV